MAQKYWLHVRFLWVLNGYRCLALEYETKQFWDAYIFHLVTMHSSNNDQLIVVGYVHVSLALILLHLTTHYL